MHVPTPRRTGVLVAATCGAQFMAITDDTIVNVALPSIRADLGFTGASLAWVVDAYMLMFGGFLLLSGRTADALGHHRVFTTGTALFAAASLAAGMASSPTTLVIARGVQGLGGALIGPSALAILVTTFPDPARRRRVLSLWGSLAGLAAVTGLLLGGVITDTVGWRWAFLVNAPVGVAVVAAVLATMTGKTRDDVAPDPTSDPATAPDRRVDLLGATLVTAGLLLLVHTVIQTAHHPWGSPRTLAGLTGAAVLLALFLLRQTTATQPLVPASLLTRDLCVAAVAMLLTAGAMFSVTFFLSQYMQLVQGWSPLRTGLSWIPFSILIAVSAALTVALTPRVGVRALTVAGLGIATAGQLLLLRTTPGGPYTTELLPVLLILGTGFGLTLIPLVVASLHTINPGDSGTASGLVTTAQQIGGAIGVAALATLAADRFTDLLPTAATPAAAMTDAFHSAFAAGACVTALAALVVLALPALREEVDLVALQGS
ncbi:MAG: hypothetical protein QG622_3190 [Actinomycetota bacterium]|nr:hypothetical protein [Actinomycetota bacterium]